MQDPDAGEAGAVNITRIVESQKSTSALVIIQDGFRKQSVFTQAQRTVIECGGGRQ